VGRLKLSNAALLLLQCTTLKTILLPTEKTTAILRGQNGVIHLQSHLHCHGHHWCCSLLIIWQPPSHSVLILNDLSMKQSLMI